LDKIDYFNHLNVDLWSIPECVLLTVGACDYIALGLFISEREFGVKEVKEHNTVAHKKNYIKHLFPSAWMMWNPF